MECVLDCSFWMDDLIYTRISPYPYLLRPDFNFFIPSHNHKVEVLNGLSPVFPVEFEFDGDSARRPSAPCLERERIVKRGPAVAFGSKALECEPEDTKAFDPVRPGPVYADPDVLGLDDGAHMGFEGREVEGMIPHPGFLELEPRAMEDCVGLLVGTQGLEKDDGRLLAAGIGHA